MKKIHNYIESQVIKTKLLLQVHDELIFEIEKKELQNTIPQIKNIMESNHTIYRDFQVPLVVEYGMGDNWGLTH